MISGQQSVFEEKFWGTGAARRATGEYANVYFRHLKAGGLG
jgi:hypothetical protein